MMIYEEKLPKCKKCKEYFEEVKEAKKIFVDLITNDSTLFSYEEVDEIVHMIAMCNKMLNHPANETY